MTAGLIMVLDILSFKFANRVLGAEFEDLSFGLDATVTQKIKRKFLASVNLLSKAEIVIVDL